MIAACIDAPNDLALNVRSPLQESIGLMSSLATSRARRLFVSNSLKNSPRIRQVARLRRET